MQLLELLIPHMNYLLVLVFFLPYFFLHWDHICSQKDTGLSPECDIILFNILKYNLINQLLKMDSMNQKEQIINDIKNTPIILYMKGAKERPMCGFSARVVNILNQHSVVYQDVNILENPDICVNLSEYSN